MIFYCLLADEMQYCSNKQDIILFPDWQVRWFFMILVHRSTGRWHEMTDEKDKRWWRRVKTEICMEEQVGMMEDRKLILQQETMEMAVGGVGGKRAVTTEFDCCVCYAILSSMLQRLLRGGGGSLQVDELVHQQQGARQAGQAGFRATTVTTRVASWNWPGETRGGEEGRRRGGKQKERREAEEQGSQTSKDSSERRGGWGRERREEQGEEFTHLIVGNTFEGTVHTKRLRTS